MNSFKTKPVNANMLPLLVLLFATTYLSEYVPWAYGATWTELIAVKGHLFWIMENKVEALGKVPAGPLGALNGTKMSGKDIYHR